MASIDPKALRAALGRIRDAPPEHDLRVALLQVCETCVELFGVTGSGLMVVDDEQALRYVVATDSGGRVLEKVQAEVGVGPCVDALVHDEIVQTRDVTDDPRWPVLRAALGGGPVCAVLGLPVHVGGMAIGSLNVYRAEPHDWDPSEVDALLAFNGIVQHLVGSAILAEARDELVEQLQHALDRRVMIERAVGVLMGRQDIDSVTAYGQLRTQARAARRRVAEVADDVLRDLG